MPAGTAPDIPLFDLELKQEDFDAVAEVLRSGRLAMGSVTEAFEQAFAEQLGVRHVVAVSNCTAALHLAYLAAGVGPGDEVIVPSMTFAATAAAVIHCGGTPVFADIVGQHDLSIDPDDVAAKITPRTKAVAAVHFAGYAAPVDRLRALCDEHGLALIEDAAHAPSARLGERKLGTYGLAGCFSLFSNKVISVGEGGMVSTDDDTVAEFVRRYRSHAIGPIGTDATGIPAPGYDVTGLGCNYRFDEPRAALALSRLARLELEIGRRRELTHIYRQQLRDLEGITLPFDDEDVDSSSCYVMPVMLDDPERQLPLRQALREQHGVQTSLLYESIHLFTAYRERWPGVSLPRTELASRTEVTIPLFPDMTEEQQGRVVEALTKELTL
jgi:dTDP-4-amino-4,6-dideoxygalactose transaminase